MPNNQTPLIGHLKSVGPTGLSSDDSDFRRAPQIVGTDSEQISALLNRIRLRRAPVVSLRIAQVCIITVSARVYLPGYECVISVCVCVGVATECLHISVRHIS